MNTRRPEIVVLSCLLMTCAGIVAAPLDARIECERPSQALRANFRIGSRETAILTLEWADEKAFSIHVVPQPETLTLTRDGTREKVELPDARLLFRELRVPYYIRPRPRRYTETQQAERLSDWLAMPGASEHEVTFEAIPDRRGVEFYIDRRYAGRIERDTPPRALRLRLPEAGEIGALVAFDPRRDDRFLPLDFGAAAQPGSMRQARLSIAPGPQTIESVPMRVASGERSGDIGRVREMKGSWALECDEYLSRTTFDGMPESQMLTVPKGYYHRAWVLFAVDPNPERDARMTVRLTRFAGQSVTGRGAAFADADVDLPRGDEPLPESIRRVGHVMLPAPEEAPDTGETELPLYLARVDLPIGEMLDLLAEDGQDPHAELKIGPYLDFEILGRRGALGIQWDRRHKPARVSSAAQVFGVTLERAPAELRLVQSQPGNIFHNDETPEVRAEVRALREGSGTLAWTVRDIDGREIRRESATIELIPGETNNLIVPLAMEEPGHYALTFEFRDDAGHPLLQHQAAFALLGKDTREAGYDSPYGVWWFGGSHQTIRDLDVAGPLHLKAGLRRTVAKRFSEAEMAPWKMTAASFGWLFRMQDLDNFEAARERVAGQLADLRSRYPHCDNVLIYHESHANRMPIELAGREPEHTETQREALRKKAALANRVGAFYRERFPDLKIVVGNTSGTAQLIADLLRFGFDRRRCDAIGIETPGQTFLPESISEHNLMAAWACREIGRMHGHEIPLTATYEFTYRLDRILGGRRQAAYYARDILLAHAYGFEHISPAVLDDAGSSYGNSLWGASGLVQRNPLLYPKPAYVAVATATKVLDRARVKRIVPTGSLTVYCLEFARTRAQPDIVYALWTPRGEARVEFDFGADVDLREIELFGRARDRRTQDGKVTLAASPEARYLICPAPVREVHRVAQTYEQDRPPDDFVPAHRMDRADDWRMMNDYRMEGAFRRRGKFTLRPVEDPEKGACLELELHPDRSLPPLVAEYTTLCLKTPVEVPGRPHTIGLWVRGNSNWGRIYFEIADAEGRLWRSSGGYNDWPADLAVNFDGWRFLRFHIDPERSPIPNHSPGFQWVSSGGGKRPVYPIRITGIVISMYREAVDPVEMRPVSTRLRFRDIGAYE